MSYQHPEMDILHMADMVEDIHSVTNLMGKCTYLILPAAIRPPISDLEHQYPDTDPESWKVCGLRGGERLLCGLQQ